MVSINAEDRQKVEWQVSGITCASCALTIHKTLQKKGMDNININALNGVVSFETQTIDAKVSAVKAVEELGYSISEKQFGQGENSSNDSSSKLKFSGTLLRFLICLPFTLVLMLHMIPSFHNLWIFQPWIQFFLALPYL